MKNRVSNAPVSLTRRYEAHLQSKRRGQALLLAVVVMLFVALISAGFLATVSGNLNQTARTSEKNSAIESAKAGMAYINNRINTSAEGENWRPISETTIPLLSNPNEYNAYYSQLAQVQGWVRDNARPELSYGRFPDPRTNPSSDSPKFYAKVERLGYDPTTKNISLPINNPDFARAGMLKITVIGLGKNDPSVFHKAVAYRGGYDAAPIGRVMRAVSNYDFVNKVVPSGKASVTAVGATVLNVNVLKGEFPEKNFSVTISDGNPTSVQSAVVLSRSGGSLTLASGLAKEVTLNANVELAANLGAPTSIDYNLDATPEPLPDLTTDPANALGIVAPQSVRVNGGVRWEGNLKISDLRSKVSSYPTGLAPKTLESSGVMNVATGSTEAGTTAADKIPDSVSFPTTNDIINDGFSRLNNDLTATRQTKPFNPPDLTSQSNLARFRGLTRDSKPAVATDPAEAAQYGYGQGIYIPNNSDRERIYDTTTATPKWRDMSYAQLLDIWYSSDATLDFARLGPAKDRINVPEADESSLEQQHVRGWITRDQFVPRGALVELDPTAKTVTITLEPRDDKSANNKGPVATKAWRTTSGTVETGVYRKVLPWPKNGTIFAEGNIRIKGGVTLPDTINSAVDPGNSLTVVSMGNIYIEGSINAGGKDANRKILLLAKKNVVVNPTQLLGNVDSQSVANTTLTIFALSTGPTDTINLPVYDTTVFKKGDLVDVEGAGQAVVVQVNSTDLQLRVVSVTTPSTLPATNPPVRTIADNYDPTTGYSSIAQAGQVIQRRINANDFDLNTRLVFNHRAANLPALTVEAKAIAPDPLPANPIFLANKNAIGKQLITNFTEPTTGSDPFPAAPHVDNAAADAYTIQSLADAIGGPSGPTHSAPPTTSWEYDAIVGTGYGALPAHYMAKVGSIIPVVADVAGDRRENINGSNYVIPLSTSILPLINGETTTLTNSVGTVGQIGFAPQWDAAEDTLTADRTFYEAPESFVDSRTLTSTGLAGTSNDLVMRQNEFLIGISPTVPLPTYQVRGLKLENIDATGNVLPAATFDIRAFVYAQEGSWLIISGDYFNFNLSLIKGDTLKSYYDINGNSTPDPGEYVDVDTNNAFSDGDCADMNRDGVRNSDELISVDAWRNRYARYNYKINFSGTIAEGLTPLVNDASTTLKTGIVASWMDKWANYSTVNGWKTINYQFDDSYVTGKLDSDPCFRMPVANDITYQE